MANEQEAGSIIIALRAQIENLQKGLGEAKRTINAFGAGVQSAAAGIQQAGDRMGQTFANMERRSLLLASRVARLTSGFLAFQGVLSSLGNVAREGLGPMSRALEAAGVGVGTFAAIVSVLPTKLGAVTGALAGATTALVAFLAPTREAIAAGTEAAKLTEGVDEALNTLERLTSATRDRGRIIGDSGLDRAKGDIMAAKAAAEQLLILQRKLQEQRRELKERITAAEGNTIFGVPVDPKLTEGLKNQLAAVDRFLNNVPNRLEEIQQKLPGLKLTEEAEARMEAFREAVAKLNAELQDTERIVQMSLELGLVDPLGAAEQNARAAEKALQELLARAAEWQRSTGRPSVELGTAIVAARDRAAQARGQADRLREIDRQAKNMSGAISAGIVDGVMDGASSMEILANVGRNLMTNALRDVATAFQGFMTDAFKAIGSIGGVELGGLITGLAGIAGGILAQRNQSKASETFATIRDNIESTQELRGIVAGPASVSIAAVGENLNRSFAPVLEVLRAQLVIQTRIEANTRSGRRQSGGAGGLDFVAVPTA